MAGSRPLVFVLDEGWETGFAASLDIGARWMELPHAATRSRGFVLLPGEEIRSPPFAIDARHRLHLQAMRAVESISADGLDLHLILRVGEEEWPLAAAHLGNEQRAAGTLRLRVDLSAYAGQRASVILRCLPGLRFESAGDWAAVLAFAIAPDDELDVAVARSQHGWRLANERAQFCDTYKDAFYGIDTVQDSISIGVEKLAPASTRVAGPADATNERYAAALAKLQATWPVLGESARTFAERLLEQLMPGKLIDFAARLRSLAQATSRPRILSFCSGEARIEAMLVDQAGLDVDITLVDVNPGLLRRAAGRFPAGASVRLVEGEVEHYQASEGGHDVVVFVSGLHHLVELEAVLDKAAAALAPHGEFWLVGEQVGPNGNRLSADALRVANRHFAALPARLRQNRYTGDTDPVLPDLDFSTSTFEGIRSQDIRQCLARHFVPVIEDVRNCFLWRCVDLAYAANYDFADPVHVQAVRTLVAAEFAFYADGGLGCELNGVYRKKLLPS